MGLFDLFKKKQSDENNGVNADKIFIRNVGVSFVGIIICIVMLSASSYAWFSTTIESNNSITSSVYKLDIGVVEEDGGVTPLTATVTENGDYVYSLEAGKTYTVTITALAENTTGKTGYIKLRTSKMAEDDRALYSEQIDRGDTISFNLHYTDSTDVTIIEGWGMSSVPEDERDILNGGSYGDSTANGS